MLLVVAVVWRRRDPTIALAGAVVFGLVFSNPLGVVAERSTEDQRPVTPFDQADTSPHWLKIAGIPVAWFAPYAQQYPWAFENSPRSVLKLRYGFPLLPSTGASTVVRQCDGTITIPCWEGEADDAPLVHRDGSGRTWLMPLKQTNLSDPQGGFDRADVPVFYEARVGVPSARALVYWVIVGLFVLVAAARRRVRWRLLGIAVVGSLATGLVVSGVVAAASTPARSASSQPGELLPLPADPPKVAGTVSPTPIEEFGPGCIERVDNVPRNVCSSIVDLAAAETSGGIMAVWTAGSDGFMHLRTRIVSSDGRPLGSGSELVTSWDQSSPDGRNCEVPAQGHLRATQLSAGRVLVAWTESCQPYGAPATIAGLVLDDGGARVRGPFVIARFPPRWDELRARFWLSSTSTGEAFLLWEDASKSVRVSRLDDRMEAKHPRTLFRGENGIGSIAVACGTSCIAAHGRQGTITYKLLSSHGDVTAVRSIAEGPAPLHSELAAAATGDRFVVGWLESDGVNVDARLAAVQSGDAPVVTTVARDIPNGNFSDATIPKPFGIAVAESEPALAWQSTTYLENGDPRFLLHVSSSARAVSRSIELNLGSATVAGDGVLVAIAGLWNVSPPQPVAVAMR